MRNLQDHSPRNRKWLLQHDHKQVLALFHSGKFWLWFFVAWSPALCAIGYRTITNFTFGPVFVGTFVSAGVTAILIQSAVRRMVVSNRVVFLRDSEPIRFCLSMILLSAGYILAIIGILKA